MLLAATVISALLMLKRLDQWAAVAGAALKLNRGMGDMKTMLKYMLNPAQQFVPAILMPCLNINMY